MGADGGKYPALYSLHWQIGSDNIAVRRGCIVEQTAALVVPAFAILTRFQSINLPLNDES